MPTQTRTSERSKHERPADCDLSSTLRDGTLAVMPSTSFNLPEELVESVRTAAGTDLDAWVADALRRKLAAHELDRLLDEIADEVGPLPPELAAAADAAWRAS